MDAKQMSNIVEQYSRLGNEVIGEITVTRVPDWKSVIVETIGENGRAIVMTVYKVMGIFTRPDSVRAARQFTSATDELNYPGSRKAAGPVA